MGDSNGNWDSGRRQPGTENEDLKAGRPDVKNSGKDLTGLIRPTRKKGIVTGFSHA